MAGKIKEDLDYFNEQLQYKRGDLLLDMWKRIEGFKGRIDSEHQLYKANLIVRDAAVRAQREAKELASKRYFVPASVRLAEALRTATSLGTSVDSSLNTSLQSDRSVRPPFISQEMLDAIREEFVACVFAEDQRQLQLFAAQSIPELLPKLGAVFSETIAADQSSINETDLSIVPGLLVSPLLQAPSDFEFDPRTSSVAYIKSLARGIATLDGLDVFLAFLDEAISKKILDACKAAYRRLNERYMLNASLCRYKKRPLGDCKLTYFGTSIEDRKAFQSVAAILEQTVEEVLRDLAVAVSACQLMTQSIEAAYKRHDLWDKQLSPAQRALLHIHIELRNIVEAAIHSSEPLTRPKLSTTVAAITDILRGAKPARTELDDIDWDFDADAFTLEEMQNLLEPFKKGFFEDEWAAMEAFQEDFESDPRFGHGCTVFKLPTKVDIQYLPVLFKALQEFIGWTHRLSEDEYAN